MELLNITLKIVATDIDYCPVGQAVQFVIA
jgi:hypothetical protein